MTSVPRYGCTRLRIRRSIQTRPSEKRLACELSKAYTSRPQPARDSMALTSRGVKLKPATGKVLAHVLRVRRPGKRQHPDRAGEGEHHLRRGRVQPRGRLGDDRMGHRLAVGGQQREALIADAALAAEGAHLAVPAQHRIAAVLHEGRRLGMSAGHLLQVVERHIAHPDQPRPAGFALSQHRLPDFDIVGGPAIERPARAAAGCPPRPCRGARASWPPTARPAPSAGPAGRKAGDGPGRAGR